MHSWGPFYPPFVSLAILVTMAWVLIGPIIAVWARDLRLVAILPVATGGCASAWVAVHNKRIAAMAGTPTFAANASEAMVLMMIAFLAAAIVSAILAILPYRSERTRRITFAPVLVLAAIVFASSAYLYPVVCFSATTLVAILIIAGFFVPNVSGPDLRPWLFGITALCLAGVLLTYTAHNYFMRIATGSF